MYLSFSDLMVFLNMLFCGFGIVSMLILLVSTALIGMTNPKRYWWLIKAGVSKGLSFCQNSQMGFWKEIPMSPRIGIVNAIGLWSGNIPFHLVELVLVSYGCMSKANVTYLNTKFFIFFPFQDWNFGIFWN